MFHLLLVIIYLAFISLGLPDGLLGAAWPSMYQEFQVPVSYAGIISMIIAGGTIVSSLQSDRLTLRFGPGRVTAVSVAMTAAALFGFSVTRSFLPLCFWAVPYGLGAGSVDAALNNYVALHYASRHMSWLHCMWGVGASAGPYIMGYVLSGGGIWNTGYRCIGLLQIALTAILFLSLPLWRDRPGNGRDSAPRQEEGGGAGDSAPAFPLSLRQIIAIPGAREVMVTFFCYCALEQTAGLWAASYLALHEGVSTEAAAFFASLFFIGITAGRAASGFLTLRFNDTQMIRLGLALILAGILIFFLPLGGNAALAGLIIIGLGCAPVYPCVSSTLCQCDLCIFRRMENRLTVIHFHPVPKDLSRSGYAPADHKHFRIHHIGNMSHSLSQHPAGKPDCFRSRLISVSRRIEHILRCYLILVTKH